MSQVTERFIDLVHSSLESDVLGPFRSCSVYFISALLKPMAALGRYDSQPAPAVLSGN